METLILILIILAFGFFSFPLYSYFALIGIYSAIFFDVGTVFWAIFIVLATILLIPTFRIKFITSKIVNFINKNGLLPKISKTEEAALQAGTNWVEADFFKAQINFKEINAQKVTTLTAEEQSFLDDIVDELCEKTTDWEIFQNRDLSDEVWQFIKDKKFFG
ncbi:MAG: hypothetical protein AB7D49_12780, partial [Arcobacter sp.]